ncbi:MAG: tetratricopeptide repeat protein [Candidatus Stygibacter frigidus]|nr:tetratricopeptide repeat protein [Candidatus Stygibacter frigidus]
MFLQINGIRAEICRKRGQKFLVKGINDKAVKCFRKALQLSENTENIFNLGLGLLSQMQLKEAEEYLSKVAGEFPENAISGLAYFEALILQEKWQAAIDQIAVMLGYEPENKRYLQILQIADDVVQREKYRNVKILSHQAFELMKQQKYTEALKQYEQALKFLPDDVELLNNIGYLYLKQRNYMLAYSYFEKALLLEPENRKLRQNMALVRNKLRK